MIEPTTAPPKPAPLRPLPFAATILREALRTWAALLPRLLLLALLFTLPTIPFDFDDFGRALVAKEPLTELHHPWTIVVWLVASLILQGAAALLIEQRRDGGVPSLRALAIPLLRALLPMVAAALVLLAVVLFWTLPGIVLGSRWPACTPLLLIALWPMVVFALAPAVVAVERRPPLAALRRSFDLTRGARSSLFLTFVASFLAGTLLIVGIARLVEAAGAPPAVQFNVALSTILASDTFTAVLIATLYLALRQRKEAPP